MAVAVHAKGGNPVSAAHIDILGKQVESKHAFVVLSLGTVLMIGLSCYLEEWILKALVGFKFYWTMAFFELVVFAVITYAVAKGWSGGNKLEPRAAPFVLYVAGASTMALYTSLGKIAYRYVNYATGTVLKSAKLVPVMMVSVLWLKRSYTPHDYVAAGFMVASAAFFGLGERELEPEGNQFMGFVLSFLCLGLGAVQSNIADKCLRDHGATVNENMLYTNALGAVIVFGAAVVYEGAEATAYMLSYPLAFVLLVVRSVTFWMGAWLYTMLVKHFGAVAAVAVTTARKALTVMVSFVLFPGDKPLTIKYAAAVLLFFGAVFTEYAKVRLSSIASSPSI